MSLLNAFSINSNELNSLGILVLASGEGTLISIEQGTLSAAEGSLIEIEQNIVLFIIGEGSLIEIEQNIKTYGDGPLILLEQNVKSYLPETFLTKNGYLPEIYIGGQLIPQNQICDVITITRDEGQASNCTFTLKPPIGIQTYKNYIGRPIFINIQKEDNSVKRIFTGWVDNPNIDIIDQKIKFQCSDRRTNQINQLNYNIIKSIGKYSDFVFGKAVDKSDELNKRLLTVKASFDFDFAGNPTLTDWAPKASPDFSLNNEDVYYEKPEVFHGNKKESINTINLVVSYQYQRLHQQAAQVVWNGYANFYQDWWLNGKPSFPQRYIIQTAATATSWNILGGGIRFVPLWEAGAYNGIVWQPNQVTKTYKKRTAKSPVYYYATPDSPPSLIWPDGHQYSYETLVLDVNGNPIYDVDTTTIVDTSSNLCRGASWVAGKKFSQTINEVYSIRMYSQQSIDRFGIISKQETINIVDPYNSSGWENDKTQYTANITPPSASNYILDSSGYAKGSMTLTLASGSGSVFVGNQFVIEGDPSGQIYTVASNLRNASVGSELKIFSPGLAADLEATTYEITIIPLAPSSSLNFYANKKDNYSWLSEALSTAIDKAETSLKQVNRDTTIKFKRFLWPEIDLKHTVEVNTTKVYGLGKVSSLSHTIDVSSGEAYSNITLLLSSSYGNDPQSIYTITPIFEDTSYIGMPTNVILQTHIGEDPDPSNNPVAITWNGFIGNGVINNTTRTTYNESFIVDYPRLPSSLTNVRTLTANIPGANAGVTTDNSGYSQGETTLTLAAGGSGKILQGDLITITGDTSLQVYIVQNDILDVSSGGILNIQPGLQSTLAATNYPIVTMPPANQFSINVANDPLQINFDDV